MGQIQFTRLAQKRDRGALPDGASATDVAIGQLLGLANSAGFSFDLIEGRLVTVSATPDWRVWPTLRICLDEIGAEVIIAYFERTTQERRATLSAAAH